MDLLGETRNITIPGRGGNESNEPIMHQQGMGQDEADPADSLWPVLLKRLNSVLQVIYFY